MAEVTGARALAADIAARIVRGEWKRGERLPTTSEFAAEYRVGTSTVFLAMRDLIDRGVVRGGRGGRRYVA